MKANKYVQAKGSAKSTKWKGAKGCRQNVKSSDGHTSLDLVAQKYQTDVRKKPKVKRLQMEPKHVSGSKTNSDNQSGLQKSYAHTNGNGSSTVTMDKESEESQDWNAYAQYVLGNEAQASDSMQNFGPGRLERESFIHCAERNDHKNHAVLVMQKSQTLCFRGKCLLTCLYGRVEVMGFTIEEGQQSYPLFSPASHCPLTITALGASEDARDEGMGATEILRKYLTTAQQNKLVKRISRKSSVILLEPMETALTRFLSSFTELSELFSPPVAELMSAVLDTPLNGLGVVPLVDTVPGLIVSQSFKDALNTVVSACRGDMDGCAVILVCGSKNVGKSTFNRILINTLLNHTTCIDYLECDLGQTEFTPSGCLSMSTVREPLLGPPFSHQRGPEHMMYYGQTSCETDLDRYMEILKSLWHRRPQRRETTVVINTMGWVKGLGLKLLVDMIRFFPVSHVVQLGHSGFSHCPVLTPEFLRTAHGWQTHPPAQAALDEFTESHSPPKSYVHISVQSEFKDVTTHGTAKLQRSNEQRELSLLAYLSQLQSPDPSPIRPLHCLIPYQVPHSAVAIGVTHCEVAPNHVLYAANASLVGLCCLGEKVTSKGGPALLSQTPVCPCVGLGVLRGIDMKRGLYYLLTPVDPTVLREVNCLLLGAVSLPSCILKTQPGFEGELPYVTTDYSFEVTGAGKLRVFKGLARPSQMATK